MSLCHSGDYSVSVLSSHTMSTPGLLTYEQKVLRCGAPFSEEYRGDLHCLRRLISPTSEVSAPAQFANSAVLLIWAEKEGRSTSHSPMGCGGGGSMFQKLLYPSSFSAAPCSFPITSSCFSPLEHRGDSKVMTSPVTWPWNCTLLCAGLSWSTLKRENLHNCVTKNPSWAPSLPCDSALETWNLLPAGMWQNWLWGSKETRWVMCVKNK